MLAKKNLNRLLSSLLAVIMLLGLLPTAAFASTQHTSAEQIEGESTPVYYTYNEEKQEFTKGTDATNPVTTNTTSSNVPNVKTSKVIKATDTENQFDLTLKVETTQKIEKTETAPDAAVILVFDLSASMQKTFGGTTRLAAAQKAANDFLSTYVGFEDGAYTDPHAKRYVAIVGYSNGGLNGGINADGYEKWYGSSDYIEQVMGWTDLHGTTQTETLVKLTAAQQKISGMQTDHYKNNIGTNTDAGLKAAEDLWKNAPVAVQAITNRFTVLLTDGEPNKNTGNLSSDYTLPTGYNNSYEGKDYKNPAKRANKIITTYHSQFYSVCAGWEDGYDWLKSFSNEAAYAENADSLSLVFETFIDRIQMAIDAWKVTDPMGQNMSIVSVETTGHDGYAITNTNNKSITWNLRSDLSASSTKIYKKADYEKNPTTAKPVSYADYCKNTDEEYTIVYSLTYRVAVNNTNGVENGVFYLTNGRTTLDYYLTKNSKYIDNTGKEIPVGTSALLTMDFKVPAVKALSAQLSLTKLAYGKALSGATFTLTHDKNCACGAQTNKTWSDVSGNDGKVTITGIPSGHTYTMTETPPNGYAPAQSSAVKVAWGQIDAKGTTIPTADGKYVVTNTRLEGTKSVTFTKNWVLSGETRPQSISVIVERRASGSTDENAWTAYGDFRTIATTEKGSYEIETLPKYNTADGIEWEYRVREANVVDGVVTIGNDKYEVSYDGSTITNKLVGTTSVSFAKDWAGEDAAKHANLKITVLLKDGDTEVNRMTVGSGENWSGTFTKDKGGNDLPKNRNGSPINYTIEEAKLDNYASEVKKNDNGTFTITNTRNNEDITINGTKRWVDYNNAYGTRPESVTIELYRGTAKINETTTSATQDWKYSFSKDAEGNLLKLKDAQGEPYTYTVKEQEVKGYTSQVNGYDITNTVTDTDEMLASVSVSKKWVAPDDVTRPEVTVTLLRGSGKNDLSATEQTATLNESNGWKNSFEKLPRLDKNTGEAYTYDVQEIVPGGYKQTDKTGSAADGFVITNTYQTTDDDTVSVSATKLWKDEGDTSGRQTVTVKVLENTKGMVGTLTLSADTWSDSIILDKYKLVTPEATEENPNPESSYEDCVYTLEEITVPGYQKGVIDGSVESGFTITNTILPGERKLNVTKTWNDPSGSVKPAVVFDVKIVNVDNTLTDTSYSITVASGSTTDSVTVPKFDGEGKTIRYTLVERSVGGFSAGALTGSMEEGFAITNSINQSYTQVSGTKDWQGVPADTDMTTLSATVYLERSENGGTTWTRMTGEEYTKTLDSTNWTYKWEHLPVYNETSTVQYSYRVREEAVEGYYTTYTGNNITNTYNLTSIPVRKIWNDPHTEEVRAARPGVTFELYAAGTAAAVQTYDLSADDLAKDTFTHTFKDLPIRDKDGETITYTVEEKMAEGSSYVSGSPNSGSFVFTNTIQNPETPNKSFRVTKKWENMDTTLPDGTKPSEPVSIWVQLYKGDAEHNNGTHVGDKVELTAKDRWAHNFDKLDTYNKDGSYCTYYVREVIEDTTENGETIWTPISNKVTLDGDSYAVTYVQTANSTAITNTYTAPTKYFYQVVRHYTATVDGATTVSETASDPVVGVPADGERNIVIAGDQDAYKKYTSADGKHTYDYSFDAATTGVQNQVTLEEALKLYTVNLYYTYSYTTPVTPPPSGGDDTYYTVTVNYLEQDTQKVLRSAYSERKSEGNRYDVTNRDAITITGYSYVETTGDALSGNLNGNKVINVWYTPESEIVEPDTPLNPSPEPTPDVEIPEETTPLNPVPEQPGTETGTEIEEPEVPLGKLPQTGFVATPVEPSMTIGLLAVAFSLVGAGLHLTFGRKKAEEEE